MTTPQPPLNQSEPQPYPPPPPQQPRQVNLRLQTGVRQPMVTYVLMGITTLFFVLQIVSEYALGFDLPAGLGAKINQSILSGQVWRLITPVLLHGNIPHILVNMYALYGIGRGLERYYGHVRFLGLYLLGGFAGNVLSFIFSPNPSLGSSTAIFGLLAAEGVMVFQNRAWFGNRFRSIMMNILGVAAVNLFIGATVPGIDNWGHLGGLLGGALFAWFAGPKWEVHGLLPNLELHDQRSQTQVVISFIGVGLVFIAVTLGAIILNLPKP